MVFARVRGPLLWQAAIPGWELWVIGTIVLVVMALSSLAIAESRSR
jgi:hypothetical protein